ncbi:MAG: AAA family ATPase [Thioploca sp.]|nr:AAA family ATPase [Thioploca sp.]
MKKLPLGIQTFSKLIKNNCLYVDKTQYIVNLIQAGDYLFLSRPRRFGKSLLVSTLYEIFSGNQALFQGLSIYNQIDWQPYPVIVIDFATLDFSAEMDLQNSLIQFMDSINDDYQLNVNSQGFKTYFKNIIVAIYKKYGKVVILVDEYDKPIVEYMDNIALATKNRDLLNQFFGVLKSSEAFLRFVFLTGVSKFARVSIFSGLNNLRDLTFSHQFANLLGYTQEELETNFEPHLQHLGLALGRSKAELLAQIKTWYNGYSWNAKDRLYNPFSILNLLAEQQFDNYWFASGTPTFLMQLLKNNAYEATVFENKKVPKIVFDSYNIENMNVFALLFQTGYLTLTDIDTQADFTEYTLNYPNFEVKQAFITYLFKSFTHNGLEEIQPAAKSLRHYLQTENLEGFMTLIRALLAKIPYPLHIEQEAYYHSLFYMIAILMGVEIDLEVLTDKGRIDGVLALTDKIYLLEFKYGKASTSMKTLINQAIQQIQAKHYGERFLNDLRPRFLLGIGFVNKEMDYKLLKAKD